MHELGKVCINVNGANPEVIHTGRVPVVVWDRENLLHGEEEQFEWQGCELTNLREVKTFDN